MIEVTEVRKVIPPVDVTPGEYRGAWSGYEVTFSTDPDANQERNHYWLRVSSGIRGAAPVKVLVADDGYITVSRIVRL